MSQSEPSASTATGYPTVPGSMPMPSEMLISPTLRVSAMSNVPVPPAPIIDSPYMRMMEKMRAKQQARDEEINNMISRVRKDAFKTANRTREGSKSDSSIPGLSKFPSPFLLKDPIELENILELSARHRKTLLYGDTWNFFVGDEVVYEISKNLVLTASTKAQDILKAGEAGIAFEKGVIEVKAIRELLKWLERTCKSIGTFSLPPGNNMRQTLSLIRLAYLMGVQRYVHHLELYHIRRISKKLLSYEEITQVIDLAVSENDPIFAHLADRLAALRYHKQIPDPEVFATYLEEHPKLANAMATVDAKKSKQRLQREATRARQLEWLEEMERQEQVRRERNEQRRKDQELAASVRQKLNAGGGVLTMTEEEAQLLKRW
jgi:hypothetical protein